jgi:hypothetical protein
VTIKREDVNSIKTVSEQLRNTSKCYCSNRGLCAICRTPVDPSDAAEESQFLAKMTEAFETEAFDNLMDGEIDPDRKPQ